MNKVKFIMYVKSIVLNKSVLLVGNPITDWISNMSTEMADIGRVVAIVAFIICGIVLMLGEKMAQQAKTWILRIVIGIALIVNAIPLVNWLLGL